MKVTRSGGPASFAGVQTRAPAAPGFAPQGAGGATAPAAAGRAGASAALTSLDALMALQETTGPLERRRRAVQRGGRLLDGLEALKLAMVEGGPAGQLLHDLQGAASDLRDRTDDEGLEAVLNQIDLRAAVELAKRELRAA